MDTTPWIDEIGQTAGLVWLRLHENGPQSLWKLVKAVDAPRDVVMQAIGWLAREDKLNLEMTNRGRMVSLR